MVALQEEAFEMCGIAGYVGTTLVKECVAEAMAASLEHRGPDDQGIWTDPDSGVCLVHRRLSILDLSASGSQPMESSSGRYVAVYNGEIYNHLALRLELEASTGFNKWRGGSDTETLLACFEHLGIKQALHKLNGMFAVAVWDRSEKTMTLCRDRVGEKPLYYGWQGNTFLFGSELKALRQHPEFSNQLDRNALQLYMRSRYIPAPASVYKGIYKLPPGSFVTVDPKNRARSPEVTEQYWKFPEYGNNQERSDTEAVNALSSILGDSVESQCLSDVPIGAFLSGGIDSTAIASLMQERSAAPINTFSIGFDFAELDEAKYAKAIAEHLGTNHHELYVSAADALDVIPKLPSVYDEPFADSSQIPTILVSKMAREHVTVCLSGDGGDELFGGYNRYKYAARFWTKIQKVPAPIRSVVSFLLDTVAIPSSQSTVFRSLYSAVDDSKVPMLGTKLQKISNTLPSSTLNELYEKLCEEWPDSTDVLLGSQDRLATQNQCLPNQESPLRWMMQRDSQTYLPGDILTKVDRAAMSVSLETRVPFLSPAVISFAATLSDDQLIRDGITKWCLRELVYRKVPRRLIDRPKSGFEIPLHAWLRGELRDWAESLINKDALNKTSLLDNAVVSKVWNEHVSGRRDHASKLWTVLMLQAWLLNED